MEYVVLAAWLVQAAAGLLLLARWFTRGRHHGGVVGSHVACSVAGLGLWAAFVATDRAGWGWGALALITLGNTFGDELLRGRWRRLSGTRSTFAKDYAGAVGATLTGRLPGWVTFHALFAGVVYFSALAACIIASV
jgi:hypothetical protein